MAKPKVIKPSTAIQFPIEKGVAMPEHTRGGGRANRKYPWPALQMGDSIFVQGQGIDGGASNSARKYAKNHGVKLTCRTVDGGIRIWRVE